MLGVSSSPVVLFLAVVWPMISVFLTFLGPQPPQPLRPPQPPHVYQVTLGVPALGGGGPRVHQVALGITALWCGFPPTGHLQFGSLFHPLHLHHP